eukprot:GEMP01016463.1.p1 GENE.GEMP01016463.1~~GEMP01016463.1.p1  ORF type:complete len:481 (-),score=127.46 GEMP01016463.1:1353-2795(-)
MITNIPRRKRPTFLDLNKPAPLHHRTTPGFRRPGLSKSLPSSPTSKASHLSSSPISRGLPEPWMFTCVEDLLSPFSQALKVRHARDEEANKTPSSLSPNRGDRAHSHPASPTSSHSTPLSHIALEDFWGSMLRYMRSTSKLVEEDGEEKAVEMRAMHGAQHVYVRAKKGCRGKTYQVSQDAFSCCVLPSGQKTYVLCEGHEVGGELMAERLSRTLPYFLAAPSDEMRMVDLSARKIKWAFSSAQLELIAYAQSKSIDLVLARVSIHVVLVRERDAPNETTIWSAHTSDISRTVSMFFKRSFDLESTWAPEDHSPPSDDDQKYLGCNYDDIADRTCTCVSGAFGDSLDQYIQGEDDGLSSMQGDRELVEAYFQQHEPEIHVITKPTEQIGLVLIASDGLWAVAQKNDVVRKVTNVLKTRLKFNLPLQAGLLKVLNILVSDAVDKWTSQGAYRDDMTCMLAFLNSGQGRQVEEKGRGYSYLS